MDENNTEEKTVINTGHRRNLSTWQLMWRSLWKAKFPLIAIFIMLVVIACAIFAPVIAPHDPNEMDILARLLPPSFVEGGQPEYILGTDTVGRDVLSRLIYGARVSLLVGFAAVFVAGFFGILIGLIAGYMGGWVDDVIMRIADIQLAFPYILLAISVLAVVTSTRSKSSMEGQTFFQQLIPLILTLGISLWVTYARTARSMALSLREKEYVDAARALGDSTLSIIVRNILPNSWPSLIVLMSFNLASTILSESSLSFLGLGVPPSVPTWGGMLAESREMLIAGEFWLALIPGLAIVITVLSINLIGDWLRDFLDPRLRS